MLNLTDYEIITEIYNSPKRIVYRGIRLKDQQPVILKCFGTADPTPTEIARLHHEYEITKHLNLSGIIKPITLLTQEHHPVLIFEDMGGISLKKYLNSHHLELDNFLSIALQIAQTLGELHQYGIVHKDIKPSNLILNPDTFEVKLTDFALASQLTRENPSISHPNLLEGSLAYMSPEQTGRMNRAIDYRTDFYSLGVTFYEILTGELPCDSDDVMELVHCHIARIPIPPNQINSQIPQVISDLIMKLLAKTAEDRYQSGFGLKVDLENCLNQWQETRKIREFTLATQDFSGQLQIPQKLYGRERELSQLLGAFERVRVGKTEMILVTGYSGIGKSALVQEIQKPLVRHRGYFITGKFDQFKRNIPYSALIQAFSNLIHQLLTESPQQIQIWQEKLLKALGTNSQIIIDVIPEVELIIGKQPPVLQIGAVESQNRFNLVFQKFIDVFTQKGHPLVLFLDDLQWADFASLKLIQLLITSSDSKYLLLIAAYRDNEVYPTHPLAIALDNISATGAIINKIKLLPLQLEDTICLIADTLQTDSCSVEPLAALVERKTEGNPFFVNQFLKTLYQENLLVFKRPLSFTSEPNEKNGWCWNIDQIEAMGITENVIELMIGKLKKLPEFTQYLLQLAACVGNSFDLQTLAIISETSPKQAFQNLLPALQEGLILPTSDLEISDRESANSHFVILTYTFLHDRVQQSAYSLIEPQLQQEVHLQIGRLLLANISPEQQAERIFELVDHLNLGWSLIDRESEKLELAQLNILAARKAKDSLAYKAARDYLFFTLSNFTTELWKTQYQLALKLHQDLAEIEYLNGNFEASEALIAIVLHRSNSALEKAEVYNMLIVQYTLLMKYEAAIEAGLKALKLLGFELPETEWLDAVQIELTEARDNLEDRQVAELIHEEKMNDPGQKMALKLLGNMGPLTFFSHQDLWQWTVIKAINLSLKYGFVAGGSYCYSCYGIIVSIKLGDYQSGYEFGKLSLALSQNFKNWTQNCQDSVIFSNYLNCWINHIKTTHLLNEEAFKIGVESGNLQWSGYNRMFQALTLFYEGINLERVQQENENFLWFCYQTKNQWASDIILANQIAISQLIGKCNKINETEYFKSFHEHQSWAALCEYYVVKAQALYLFQQYDEALKYIQLAGDKIDFIMGHISSSNYNFYYSLILTFLYPFASESTQQEYLQILFINQKQMKVWADLCPENFSHKYLLVAAEMARISGKDLEAMDLYDRAISSAREHNFIQNEALANELSAYFWRAKGKEKFTDLYLKEAYYNYQAWGAWEKVKALEKAHPQLTSKSQDIVNKINNFNLEEKLGLTMSISASNTSSSNPGIILDLATVMKASQAIASEINLNKLLIKLVQIVLENAGAQSGVLLLNQENQLFIEAAGTSETDNILVRQSIPIEGSDRLPLSIINYVVRTQENIVLTDASEQGNFVNDSYIIAHQTKSVLCTPIVSQGKLIGILYLENNLIAGAFTSERTQLLKLLCSQAAISLENAQLYEAQKEYTKTLERQVQERTHELQQQKALFDAFFTASKAGFIIYDKQLRYVQVNETIAKVNGMPAADHIGKTLREVIPHIAPTVEPTFQQILATGEPVLNVEVSGETASQPGVELHWLVSYFPLPGLDGKPIGVGVVLVEITDRKRAEEALRHSEERWQLALNGANDGIWDWNIKTNEVFISPRYKQMLGYEDHEMANSYEEWEIRLHPEERDSIIQELKDHLERKTSFYTNEHRLRCKDGTYKWILARGRALWDENGKAIRVSGSIADITERKRAEAALQESERVFRAIFNGAMDAMTITDDTAHYVDANPAACQLFGFSKEELLKTKISDFNETGIDFAPIWQSFLEQGQFAGEYRLHRFDGTVRDVEFSASANFIPHRHLSVLRDISDRKLAEAALQQAKEAADAASRAKGEFLSKMSHELRTPLNAILGFSQLLNRDSSLTSQQQEYLGIINRAGEHLLTLINDVLEMSKIEAGRIELRENTFNLHHLLNSLKEMFQLRAESKGLKLNFNQAPNVPQYIQTDESKLRQVLINLLGNAIKFTETGNVLLRVITIENVDPTLSNPPTSQSYNQLQITRLLFEIEDTGPGIAAEEIDTLFEAFVQTETGRKSESGTGLGLPISRQFVQLMGGAITVSSLLNQGTSFKFDIQVKSPEIIEVFPSTKTQKVIGLAPHQSSYRILVVEDKSDSRLLLVKLLSEIGFEVKEATNGQIAVSLTQEWLPHLIWMDMQMPIMNGYEATKQIRVTESILSRTPSIIIALTANAFAEDKAAVLSAGCNDFVSKPFREEVIFDKIAEYLEVRYVYEQTSLSKLEQSAENSLEPELFQGISPDWIAQLYQAAQQLDDEQVKQLNTQIYNSHPLLASTIENFTKKLRFDTIIEVIKKMKNP